MTKAGDREGFIQLGRELIDAIYVEFESDRWAIIKTHSEHMTLRVYEIGAVMHSTILLDEILDAAEAGRDLTVSVMSRAHIEANLIGVFILLGGKSALDAVAADSRAQDETTANELDAWDKRLASLIKNTEKRLARISKRNSQIKAWNDRNPDLQPVSLIELPHVPRANYAGPEIGVELRKHISGVTPNQLPFRQVVDKASKLALSQRYSNEPFDPIYHVYRLLSAVGVHTSLGLLDGYLDRNERSLFVRGAKESQLPYATEQNLINGIYTLALMTEWLMRKYEVETVYFGLVRKSLESQPLDLRGWTPGL